MKEKNGRSSLSYASLRRRYSTFWPLILGFANLAAIFVLGVIGYMTVEGWPLLDSYYMVVLTLSTVGFQEIHPLSDAGRLMTSALILLGVGTFAYLVGSFSQILVEGRLQTILGRRKVQKRIDALSGHFIVCGYGRIGSIVVREILRENLPIVVIEKDLPALEKLVEQGILHVNGDATDDEVLLSAGLCRAKTLISTLTLDAANVYVTLTARQLNAGLQIVSRAESEKHISRLERAGANRVFLPHIVGGVRMAHAVLRPTVTDFLDLAMQGGNLDLQMEELRVSPTSSILGMDILTAQIRPRFNLIIVAIKKASGDMLFNPTPDTVLAVDDTLVAVGKKESLAQFQAIL